VALFRKSKLVYSEMLHVFAEKPSKYAPIFISKKLEIPNYDFGTFKSCGLKLDLNFALDLTISNGNFKKGEKSLHPHTYAAIMKQYGEQFEPLAPKDIEIWTLGFGAK
jgi:hypothetical protein